MKEWMVETQVKLRRQYFVNAETYEEALAISLNTPYGHEEEIDEETICVVELYEEKPEVAA